MNENLTFVLRNRKRGNTYFAFTDAEFGILFGEGTPPTTRRMFLGWWNLNKDEPLQPGVSHEVGFSKSAKDSSTITVMTNNKPKQNDDQQ